MLTRRPFITGALLLLVGCQPAQESAPGPLLAAPLIEGWALSSPDFEDGQPLPGWSGCDGEGSSPALAWTPPPEGTGALALLLSDPSSHRGRWVSWLLFDLDAELRAIPRGESRGTEGINDDNWLGYGAPCPLRGDGAHPLYFELYALDAATGLPRSTSLNQLRPALRERGIGVAVLTASITREDS